MHRHGHDFGLMFSIEKGGGPGPRGTKGTEPFELDLQKIEN